MSNFKQTLANLYRQYELVTCINMFEPWEKKLINGFVLVVVALVVFSSCVYLPTYMETLLQSIMPLPWSRSQSGDSVFVPHMQTQKMRMG